MTSSRQSQTNETNPTGNQSEPSARHDAPNPDAETVEAVEAVEATEQEDQAEQKEPSVEELLRARVHELEAKLNATLIQYKEALDGFEAAKHRIKRELTAEIQKGRRELVVPFLDVLDNLDRALESSNAAPDDALFKGVSMVREQFIQRLTSQGFQKLSAIGKPFDPNHFEAISTVPVANSEQDGTVVGVVREAYVMGDETVRHGLVAVGKYAGE